MSTEEWSILMSAPWGKFDEDSKFLKTEAFINYTRSTEKFWNNKCLCANNGDGHIRKNCTSTRKR